MQSRRRDTDASIGDPMSTCNLFRAIDRTMSLYRSFLSVPVQDHASLEESWKSRENGKASKTVPAAAVVQSS